MGLLRCLKLETCLIKASWTGWLQLLTSNFRLIIMASEYKIRIEKKKKFFYKRIDFLFTRKMTGYLSRDFS